MIEAVAVYRGGEHPVAVRVGGHAGRIYLDLCNERWQAAEVDAEGWRVVDQPPIRFIRSRGMLPLPKPVRKKKTKNGIRALRKFINVKDDADFALVVAWELAAFRDHGPYPRAGAHSPGPETPMICTSQLHARTSFRSTTLVPCRNGSPTPCAGSTGMSTPRECGGPIRTRS